MKLEMVSDVTEPIIASSSSEHNNITKNLQLHKSKQEPVRVLTWYLSGWLWLCNIHSILSDYVPIGGSRRVPHLIIAVALSFVPWFVLAHFVALRASSFAYLTVLLITTQNVGAAMADIVMDAIVAETAAHKERFLPRILPYPKEILRGLIKSCRIFQFRSCLWGYKFHILIGWLPKSLFWVQSLQYSLIERWAGLSTKNIRETEFLNSA